MVSEVFNFLCSALVLLLLAEGAGLCQRTRGVP